MTNLRNYLWLHWKENSCS